MLILWIEQTGGINQRILNTSTTMAILPQVLNFKPNTQSVLNETSGPNNQNPLRGLWVNLHNQNNISLKLNWIAHLNNWLFHKLPKSEQKNQIISLKIII